VNEREIAIYVRTMAAQLRTMPLIEAVPFLQGALAIAGDHPAMGKLRGTMRDMVSADDQLEQLCGQLHLNLNGKDGQ
jgi:hypothetical protein